MKLKKVTALTLAAAMTFSLIGCGGNDAPADTVEEAPAEEGNTNDAAATEDTAEADSAEDDPQRSGNL